MYFGFKEKVTVIQRVLLSTLWSHSLVLFFSHIALSSSSLSPSLTICVYVHTHVKLSFEPFWSQLQTSYLIPRILVYISQNQGLNIPRVQFKMRKLTLTVTGLSECLLHVLSYSICVNMSLCIT